MVYDDDIFNTFKDICNHQTLASPSRAAEGSLWALCTMFPSELKVGTDTQVLFCIGLGYWMLMSARQSAQPWAGVLGSKEQTLLLSSFPHRGMFVPSRAQVAELGVPGKVAECAKLEVRRSSFFREREWKSCATGAECAGANNPLFFFCGAREKNISGSKRIN